jgi:hypothetical protein
VEVPAESLPDDDADEGSGQSLTLVPPTPSTYHRRAEPVLGRDGRSEIAMRLKFKGKAARALDAWYSTGNVTANLTEARNLLGSRPPEPFKNIIRDLKARDHGKAEFDEYPKNSSVLRGQAFERKASAGYLHAIDLAFRHEPPVPIRTTWETGAGNTDFEFHSTDGGDHVEVTVRIPGVEVDAADAQRLELTDVRLAD